MSNIDQVEVIFDQQRRKSGELRTEQIENRYKRLKKLREWILDNRTKISDAIYQDFKKPAEETDITEVGPCLLEVNHAMKYLYRWTQPEQVKSHLSYAGTKGYVQYEPKGVCLIISPWNYPFSLAVGPLISALAAGNTCMIKPSEMTPNTSALISEMVTHLFEEGEVAVFEGAVEVSQKLLALPFDHIFFTGSTGVGKIVMEAAAKNLSSVTLELGGKSPVIVDDTASIKDAAQRIAWGKLVNNGQTCVAPDYLLVHTKIKEKFIKALTTAMEKQFGDGSANYQQSSSYARIVNERHHQRLHQLVENAVDHGGKVVYGGEKEDGDCYLAPTLLEGFSAEAAIAEEEIFGPVLTVETFESLDDVIKKVNSRPKPLSMYVFSKSKNNTRLLLQAISAGSLAINDTVLQFAHPYL
ncbi:MAG: aldehyde dehydrogenase family protein, partial [Bacteroidota bacterium]